MGDFPGVHCLNVIYSLSVIVLLYLFPFSFFDEVKFYSAKQKQ